MDPVRNLNQSCGRGWMFNPRKFSGYPRQFLSVKGLAESPPPSVAVGIVPVGLALLSAFGLAAVSNGTAGVTIISRCTGSSKGGARTHDMLSSIRVTFGPRDPEH